MKFVFELITFDESNDDVEIVIDGEKYQSAFEALNYVFRSMPDKYFLEMAVIENEEGGYRESWYVNDFGYSDYDTEYDINIEASNILLDFIKKVVKNEYASEPSEARMIFYREEEKEYFI